MKKAIDHSECKICGHKFKDTPDGSTGNMLFHIRVYHAVEYNNKVEKCRDRRNYSRDNETMDDSKIKPESESTFTRDDDSKTASIPINKTYMHKCRSFVWKIMRKEKDYIQCKICGHRFKYHQGNPTTHLLDHIRCHHKLEYKTENKRMKSSSALISKNTAGM